ncbi:hypothetical protein ACN2WE_05290 [Streptomyces sp. cg28]|uniref:hypothetical protein n=1 Tax=Streptomyces sp. cg28 TaxID=3403457 RepID=UPI003B227856
MKSSVSALPARRRITRDALLYAPLPRLLAALDIEVVDSSITDREFLGALVQRRDGQLILAMPAARCTFEHDSAARMLLAEGLGIPASALPAALEVSRA